MALSVPDRQDLLAHMHETSFDADLQDDWVDDTLQQATDLMSIATDLDDDPLDAKMLRIIKTGIMAMAHALLVIAPDRDALYSPFSSEHAGSYTYTKTLQNAANGLATGVPWFDTAVRFYLSQNSKDDSMAGEAGVASENVFSPKWEDFATQDAKSNQFVPDFFPDPFANPSSPNSPVNPIG